MNLQLPAGEDEARSMKQQGQQHQDNHLWGHMQSVFDAAAESGVCMGSIDHNFAWDEQYGLQWADESRKRSSYLSFVMLCDHMKLLDEFFPGEDGENGADKISLRSKYALYLVAKKFAVRLYAGAFKEKGDEYFAGNRIPLIAAYWTIADTRRKKDGDKRKRKRSGKGCNEKEEEVRKKWMLPDHPKKEVLSPAREMALDCLLQDGFGRVHISLVSQSGCPSKRMDMFTLNKEEIQFMKEHVAEEEGRRDKMAAFCMGLNARLGKDSLVLSCMDGDLARMVWEQM